MCVVAREFIAQNVLGDRIETIAGNCNIDPFPADAVMWGLGQSIANSFGLAHSVAEVEGYFDAAGFSGISTTGFVPGVLTRTVGFKTP